MVHLLQDKKGMRKGKAAPEPPPKEDLQGHAYQHEIGNPDWAEKAAGKFGRSSQKRSALPGSEDTEHGMAYQKHKASSGRKANVNSPVNPAGEPEFLLRSSK